MEEGTHPGIILGDRGFTTYTAQDDAKIPHAPPFALYDTAPTASRPLSKV